MDLSPVRNRVYYCRPLAYVLTSQQLCGTEHRFQHIDADKRYPRNYILPQQPQEGTELGLVSGRRNYRSYFRYLPDCLSDGQHGSDSVYHRLLAYVPGLFLYRLFHRPQTLRHS